MLLDFRHLESIRESLHEVVSNFWVDIIHHLKNLIQAFKDESPVLSHRNLLSCHKLQKSLNFIFTLEVFGPHYIILIMN